MKLNTDSNLYTIIYVAAIVVIVAFLLAFSYTALKERSDNNERINRKQEILASLNIRNLQKDAVDSVYKSVVLADEIVDAQGNVVSEGEQQDKDGFAVERKNFSEDTLPFYICQIDGEKKYVIPMVGKGLWGAIWGYISVNSDCKTIYGAYFYHESETAGLGSLIADLPFQKQFEGKALSADSTVLEVVKAGKAEGAPMKVDGVTGATLTSNGVNAMLDHYIRLYLPYLEKIATCQ